MSAWTCERHNIRNAVDCRFCDDELISLTEEVAAVTTTCQKCTRVLADGESAWADDWVVIDPTTGWHVRETRYTCDDCEASA